ncbi:MAG TPA: MerR family transcriptional regulator [Clostridia bacterium]|nr:MerR family transcriptional regulator [Clostridia bacterium]
MDYTVDGLAKLAGVSARTLRYYDGLGLLVARRISSNGYRVYGEAEVDRLQQILFYRELGVPLGDIKGLLEAKDFDAARALEGHLQALVERRGRLDALIRNVERTIQSIKGEDTMADTEKFEGFAQKLVDENERLYGKEIREKYGEEAVERANARVRGMNKDQLAFAQRLAGDVNEALRAAFAQGDPAGELAQQACALHKQWLCLYWEDYNKEKHKGVAEMYVADPRFTAYYDSIAPGCARFLRDAIYIYCGE